MHEADVKDRGSNSSAKKHTNPAVPETRERHMRHYESGSGMKVDVKFVAKDNGDYDMIFQGKSVKNLEFNKDEYRGMKKKDFFLITFSLVDETTPNDLEVPPNPMNAIWICTSRQMDPPVCPPLPTYDQQIYAVSTDPNSGTITVRNEDMDIESFQFTLRFVHKGHDPALTSSYASYDPGGLNMNGGSR